MTKYKILGWNDNRITDLSDWDGTITKLQKEKWESQIGVVTGLIVEFDGDEYDRDGFPVVKIPRVDIPNQFKMFSLYWFDFESLKESIISENAHQIANKYGLVYGFSSESIIQFYGSSEYVVFTIFPNKSYEIVINTILFPTNTNFLSFEKFKELAGDVINIANTIESNIDYIMNDVEPSFWVEGEPSNGNANVNDRQC